MFFHTVQNVIFMQIKCSTLLLFLDGGDEAPVDIIIKLFRLVCME